MRGEPFINGVQAIEWTIDERGLAGLSDLEGIPWMMPMDQFFESWIETVFRVVAQRTGGQMRVGRKRETVHAVNWEPPYLGSQKSLVPDIWLEWESATLIVDAKALLRNNSVTCGAESHSSIRRETRLAGV